jgi:MoxR-like ATPase
MKSKEDRSPQNYILKNEGLIAAVQMALWLGKPLLLTGAPGTGKTQLAFKIASMLAASSTNNPNCATFLDKPFVFNTKTTSTSTDLFYVYDAIRHFQSRYADQDHPLQPTTAHSFIRTQALGNAILQAFGADAIRNDAALAELTRLADFDRLIRPAPMSAVVLLDEIDKAPRDFPNDLLNEIDNMEFYIQELMNIHIKKPEDNHSQVLILMTSNFEKALPDAFLRRCLFYHIPFPEPAELVEIVSARITPYLSEIYQNNPQRLETISAHLAVNTTATIKEFNKIREVIKDKTPTTSELLEWVKMLEKNGFFDTELNFDQLDADQKKRLSLSFPALTKSEADQKRLLATYVKA